MKVLITNDKLTLMVFPELKMIVHQIHGVVSGEQFRNMLMTGTDAFEEYGCTKWLSDDHRNSMVSMEDLEWGKSVWEPRILEAGWKYWALVIPQKVLGEMAMRGIMKRYVELGVTARIFDLYDEAFNWLQEQV
ncbi:MAG: hypothetical protein JXR76_18120 [Deltaproteobacteria bacterium]|nr:hypothetical protein [Deltaproteobacteria bacterium]